MSKIKRFRRNKIYQGYCFDLVKDHVLWPNGSKLDRDLILHGGISVILPVLDSNHLILIHQYRYGADQDLWELPAGTIHKNEKPLACAKREIQEEIGYAAKEWKMLTHFYTSPGYNSEQVYAFSASKLTFKNQSLEEDEILQPRVFKVAEVKKMLLNQQIIDAKSIIPLFYYLQQKGHL